MKIFEPNHPFTKSIYHKFKSQSFCGTGVIRNREGEHLSLPWFPEPKHGLLVRDIDDVGWNNLHSSEEAENLIINFRSDGYTSIQQGDDNIVWLETTLRAGDELEEFMDVSENADAEELNSPSPDYVSLKSLLAGVYLFIPGKSQAGLALLTDTNFAANHPAIKKMIDENFCPNSADAASEPSRYWNLGAYLDDYDLRKNLPDLEQIKEGDLLISKKGGLLYAGLFKHDACSYAGSDPTLVLRLQPEVSRMWIHDYLDHAIESAGLLDEMIANWAHLDSWLETNHIEIPTGKFCQIAAALTHRHARLQYTARFQLALTYREPIDQIPALNIKRKQAFELLYTEKIDELAYMSRSVTQSKNSDTK